MYMFTGSAGVNPMYMVLEILLILSWRNSGWFGLDRFVFSKTWTPYRFGTVVGRIVHRRRPVVVPAI
jgi:thiosulfate dehydrogenase [quinone] large subunit